MRTRFAPTPSGYLHIGNLSNFLFTQTLAEITGGKILLRIDDYDRVRTRKEYIDDVFEQFENFGIFWQEGPKNFYDFELHFSHVHRKKNYTDALLKLIELGLVYECGCSRKMTTTARIHACKNNTASGLQKLKGALKLNVPDATSLQFYDHFDKAHKTVEIVDFTLLRADGLMSYQLASVLDDELYKIDTIVRGKDLEESTAMQMHLAQLLDLKSFQQSAFYHLPLILDHEGNKLSKTAGSNALREMLKTIPKSEIIKMAQSPWKNFQF
jgi:glutamyl-tRNA synthetase